MTMTELAGAADLDRIRNMLTGPEGDRLRARAFEPAAVHRYRPRPGSRHEVAAILEAALGRERIAAFEALAARDAAERAVWRDAAHAEAIADSPNGKARLDARTAAVLDGLVAGGSFPVNPGSRTETLKAPFLIWPGSGIDLDASEIHDFGSWAKFFRRSEQFFEAALTFYYLWENPSDRRAVIQVGAYLDLFGFNGVSCAGGFFPDPNGGRSAKLDVVATAAVQGLWPQDPSTTLGQALQTAVSLEVDDNGFLAYGKDESLVLNQGYFLHVATPMIVELRSSVLIDVSAAFYCEPGPDGENGCVFDYSAGDFHVSSPAAFVTNLGSV